jgi:hypothetical protein
MLNQLTEFQQRQNEIMKFQAEFQANKAVGEIIAHHGSVEEALPELWQNPLTMAFGQSAINSALTGASTMKEITFRGQQIEQAHKSMYDNAFTSIAGQLINNVSTGNVNPDQIRKAIGTYAASAPPEVRSEVTQQLNAVVDGLAYKVGQIDQSTPAGQEQARKAGEAFLIGLGSQTGHGMGDFVQQPKEYGGGVVQLPGAIGGYSGIGTGAGVAPTGPAEQPGGPTRMTGPQPVGQNFRPISMGGRNSVAGDGTPLFGPNTQFNPPGIQTPYGGLLGRHILYTDGEKQSADADEQFKSDEKIYNGASNALGQLLPIERDIERLAKGGGLLTPGPGAEMRGLVDSLYMTSMSIMGKPPEVDTQEALASWQGLAKYTKQLGFGFVTSFLGQQKEAAQTIMTAISAIPGMENTPLGALALISGMRASFQREVDRRNFLNEWRSQPYTQGNLAGAEEAFNQQHPFEGYMASAMDSVGLTATGHFKDAQQIMTLAGKGMFGPTQGADKENTRSVVKRAIKKEFPDDYKKMYPSE